MSEKRKKAVVLLSGGLDSTTVLAIAGAEGYECYCLSFSYGQRQSIELERAGENAALYKARKHLVLELGLGKIGGSALTSDIDVPKNNSMDEILTESGNDIPVTYVPGRNTIFLSYAMAWAEVIGAWDIFIGINAMDYSGYPDCRPQYLQCFEALANLATKAGVTGEKKYTLHAPLMNMTKKEIIEKGLVLGVDYSKTHSCYDPDSQGFACGGCDACRLRINGFAAVGVSDPGVYRNRTGADGHGRGDGSDKE